MPNFKNLGPQWCCRDCGEWCDNLLCAKCTKVAQALGFTVQERLEQLATPEGTQTDEN